MATARATKAVMSWNNASYGRNHLGGNMNAPAHRPEHGMYIANMKDSFISFYNKG
jgi:hypothetical protein